MDTTPTPERRRFRHTAVALLAAGALVLAACSSDGDVTDVAQSGAETVEETTDEAVTDEEMTDEEMTDEQMTEGAEMLGASGPACSAVPADGEGSFAGMADDTAATAASNNPLLSTLVTAVVEADLVDTLNSDGPFTVFAPTNDAFAALPPADLDAVLADVDLLTGILTYHVIAGEKLSAADLVTAGSATTVNGAELSFAADGDVFSVNGSATTICQNVPTANATVHIIDSVLLPG